MGVQLPPEVLALHPEWASMANGDTSAPPPASPLAPPPTASVQGAPAASAAGVPVPVGSGGPPITAPGTPFQTVAPAVTGGGDPNVAQWQGNQNSLMAQQQYISAQQTANMLKPAQAAATANSLSAQETQSAAQTAYIAEQQRANEASRQREAAVQSAQQDTGNIISVARAQAERNTANKYTYELAGLAAPVEVELPPDYKGPIPPGVVARLQTLAETLAKAATNADAMDKYNVEAARIKYANTGVAVTAAEIASGRVKLTLDEAELAAQNAGLVSQQADLAAKAAGQPPAPGLVWDETASEWVTSGVLNQRQYDRNIQRGQDTQLQNNLKSPLASFSLSDLETLGSSNAITEQALIDELNRRAATEGYAPETITAIINLVHARQAANAAQSLPPPPPVGGFGGSGSTGSNNSGGLPPLQPQVFTPAGPPNAQTGNGYTQPYHP